MAQEEKAAAAEGGDKKKGGRAIMIDDPKNRGQQISRRDFARREILDEKSEFYGDRKKVADYFTKINKDGKVIPYQTVRQYTQEPEFVNAINKRKAAQKAAKEAAKANAKTTEAAA